MHRVRRPRKRHGTHHQAEACGMTFDQMAWQGRNEIALGELRQRHHEVGYRQRDAPGMAAFGKPDVDDPERIADRLNQQMRCSQIGRERDLAGHAVALAHGDNEVFLEQQSLHVT